MALSKKEIAIKLFNEQLDKIDELTFVTQRIWRSQTVDLIKEYINPTSELLSRFEGTGSLLSSPRHLDEGVENYKNEAKHLIESCIQKIRLAGIYKEKKSNYFSRLNDTWITFILLGIAGVFFFFGRLERSFETSGEIKEIKSQLETLIPVDSIPVSGSPTQSKPEKKNTEKKKEKP